MGRRAFARICGLDRVDVLVTDSALPSEMAARLSEAGIKVHAV
jgi:DeoR/GlpR family transcriptional regulator of sugar metabolism